MLNEGAARSGVHDGAGADGGQEGGVAPGQAGDALLKPGGPVELSARPKTSDPGGAWSVHRPRSRRRGLNTPVVKLQRGCGGAGGDLDGNPGCGRRGWASCDAL